MGGFFGAGATPMVGATASVAGSGGSVPAPAAGEQNKYLSGDGTFDFNYNSTLKRWSRLYVLGYPDRVDANNYNGLGALVSGTGSGNGNTFSSNLSTILYPHQYFDCGTGASGYATLQFANSNGLLNYGITENIFAIYLKLDALPSATNDVAIYIGMQNSNGTSAPTHGAYFKLTNASANWRCIHASTTESNNDSGIAADTGAHTFKIITDTTKTSKFYIDNVLVNTHNGTLTSNQNSIFVPYSAKRASTSTSPANIRARIGWFLLSIDWGTAVGSIV